MKVCKKCKVDKDFSEFSTQKSAKDGVRSSCKECLKIDARKYYLNNKEVMLSKQKIYFQKNKEELKEKRKNRYINNKKEVSEKGKLYRLKNSEKVKKSKKKYYEKNKEILKYKYKEYRLKNKENRNKSERERRKSDPLYRLKSSMRSLINLYIRKKGYIKSLRTEEVLGCTFEEFKVYVENKFIDGMSWENRSEWHLDHITPIVLATTEEEVIKLNHYTNFQPLWAIDNLKKGIKINN